MCVTLTEKAAAYLRRMIRFGQGGPAAGFRLAVKPGGCSGFDTQFSIEDAPVPGDTVVQQHGATLFLTPESCTLLQGYTIDFGETATDGGLKYLSPAARHACGCGGNGAGAGGCGSSSGLASIAFMARPPGPGGKG